jgi:hypothetical protein
MAGRRPWGAGVFAATAVAALTLLAGRAGVPVMPAETNASVRVILLVAHTPVAHAATVRKAWLPDPGSPGRSATTAAVVTLLMLCTVSLRRTHMVSAAPGSLRWVRGPPVPAARPNTAGR